MAIHHFLRIFAPISNEVYGYKQSSWDFYRSLYADFVARRPEFEYASLAHRFGLGHVLPMQVVDAGLRPSINGVALTEGDFSGAWFSQHPLRLDSGKPDVGWRLTVCLADGAERVTDYTTPSPSLLLTDYAEGTTLRFEPIAIDQEPGQGAGIEQLTTDDASVSDASMRSPLRYYNLMGQPVSQPRRGELLVPTGVRLHSVCILN